MCMKQTRFIIIAGAILLLFSCTSQKKLTYLNNLEETDSTQFYPLNRPDYRIQKQDILYVNITTANTEINEILNQGSGRTSNMFREESSSYIYGYTVSDSGTISLPLIGDVYVYNQTMEEVRINVKKKALEYLKDPFINIRLLTFKYTVIGEVKAPGSYTNFNNQLTVLEAIGRAGDITDYGDRKKVLVLRPTKEGTYTYRINLQDKNLLQSEGYFLLPNDIVVVEPVNTKIFQLNIPVITLVFTTTISTISTLILLISFMNAK
jgi:polysaccharide biosynthesis/export protein